LLDHSTIDVFPNKGILRHTKHTAQELSKMTGPRLSLSADACFGVMMLRLGDLDHRDTPTEADCFRAGLAQPRSHSSLTDEVGCCCLRGIEDRQLSGRFRIEI
jgi:hypothetical protein